MTNPRVAGPGDHDLDFDVDGMTATAVVVDHNTHEILIHLRGGYGWWIGNEGPTPFAPGDPSSRVENVDVRMRFPDAPPATFAAYVQQLEAWRDRSALLRMCSAPGRMSALIEDRDTWLPVPRFWPTEAEVTP